MKRNNAVMRDGDASTPEDPPTKHTRVVRHSTLPVMSCRRPAFRAQAVYQQPGVFVLNDTVPLDLSAVAAAASTSSHTVSAAASAAAAAAELPSSIVLMHNVLSESERTAFERVSLGIERRSGRSAFGLKPRMEVCYTANGQPYKYSGKKHFTTHMPSHIRDAIPGWLALLDQQLLSVDRRNSYTRVSHAVDILYDASFARGGSIGRHKDDEQDGWGLVLIFSLGQTRWLRIRSELTGAWHNVEARDNSLIAMLGPSFQKDYTHQIDKLAEGEEIGARGSINIRFLKADDEEETGSGDCP